MFRFVVFVLVISAVICAAAHAEGEPQRFVVPLPEHWQDATRFRLVLEGVTIPGDVPLKLRVTANTRGGREIFLGSAGIEAISRTRSEERHLKSLRLDVTRSLKRFLETSATSTSVELYIQPVDRENHPIRDLKWSVETVRLESQQVH